jgi:hypothetical protein
MPVPQSHLYGPGIYIFEQPSGSRPIVGVGTSTPGFVCLVKSIEKIGNEIPPAEGTIFEFSSWKDYSERFCKDNELSTYSDYAVSQAVVEGITKFYVVPFLAKSGDSKSDSKSGDSKEDMPLISLEKAKIGIDALAELDDISMLVIPDMVGKVTEEKDTKQWEPIKAMMMLALSKCREKKWFFITNLPANTPLDFELSQLVSPSDDIGSYGGIYHPWPLLVTTKGKDLAIPPCGAVAGIFARTDTMRGVYKAPAGTEAVLRTAMRMNTRVPREKWDALNDKGINVIRNIPREGICVYGARTFNVKNNDYIYTNVRRLTLFIEKSLDQNLQWVVFEPNNERLWGTLKREISAFLMKIYKEGGLVGSSPEEAFIVQIDAKNNPLAEQRLGILHIDIWISPTRPAEFVYINITQKTA